MAFLPLLVLLMMVNSASSAGIACSKDADCRRNVCIFKNCASRAATQGTCETNNHCFNSATESCIKSVCLARSNLEGACDDSTDCATSEAICQGAKCLMPDGKTCSKNSQCVSPSVCVKTICSAQSPAGGDCDEVADCASASAKCEDGKCVVPFDPSFMVWEGNKAPPSPGYIEPSVAVNGIIFAFQEIANSGLLQVDAYSPLTNTWTPRTGPGIYISGFSLVVVNKLVFLIGGLDSQYAPTKNLFVYNTETDKWDMTWAQLPAARFKGAAAAVDNTLFFFGGFDSSNKLTDTIFSLDVTDNTKTWKIETAVLPEKTSALSATAVGTDIFLTGGRTNKLYSSTTVLKYDSLPAGRSSNPSSSGLQTMVQPRAGHASFFDRVSNRLYVVGYVQDGKDAVEYLDMKNPSGPWASANAYSRATSTTSGGLIDSRFYMTSNQVLSVLDISAPSSLKWSPFPNSPSSIAYGIQMTGPNTITTVDTDSGTVSFYDTESDTWTSAPPTSNFPGYALSPSSAVVDDEVYIIGGEGIGSALDAVYVLKKDGTWDQKDSIPEPRTSGCAAVDGTNIYLYGGASDLFFSDPVSTLYKMDTIEAKDAQWSTITPASGSATPTAVMDCAAVVADGKLLIFGGLLDASGSPESQTGLIQSFDLATNKWDPPIDATISPRSAISAVFFKGYVFIMGGYDTTTSNVFATTEVFDINIKKVKVIADMPTPRRYVGAVTDGKVIYAVAGRALGDSPFISLEKLRLP